MKKNLTFLMLCTTTGVLIGLLLYKGMPTGALTSSDSTPTAELNPPLQTPPANSSPSYYDGIMKIAPSVVSVFSRGAPPMTGMPESQDFATQLDTSQGSGVIIDSNGLVLTNFHVIEGADNIEVVQSNGKRHSAILVGSDEETDLALLNIAASDLPAVSLQPVPRLRVGDIVLAIGNPFGLGQTVTQGIVSATGRQVPGGTAWQYFVQIDAAINPGNSGGALINPAGQLVGLNSAKLTKSTNAQGIGYAIPAELLKQVVPELVTEGRVRRGWLGIRVEDLPMFPALASAIPSGAVVTSLVSDSPATRAGLQAMDVVTEVNGLPVSSARALVLQISSLKPDTDALLQVQRADLSITLPIRLGERTGNATASRLR